MSQKEVHEKCVENYTSVEGKTFYPMQTSVPAG
jgi:hypothetical protein